ncbi:MFS transporter [bacterium]|nr:MFS transporter [bacterium]
MQIKKDSTFSLDLFPGDTLLSNTGFLNLWFAQILTQVGVKLFDFVLAIQIYKQTGSNASVSYLILAYGLPAVLFSSWAGVLIDRWRKKTTLVFISLLRFSLILLFIPLHSNFFFILLFAFLLSLVSQFFIPLEAVLIPRLVEKKHLITANSFFTLTLYSSAVVGFMGAGPLLKSVGDLGSFVFIASLFLVAGFLGLLLPLSSNKKVSIFSSRHKNLFIDKPWNSIKQGLKIVSKDPALKLGILLMGVSQIMVAMFMSLTPGLTTRVLGLVPEDASVYLIGPAAFGMVLGAALISRIGGFLTRKRLVKIGLLGSSLTFLGFSLLPEVRYFSIEEHLTLLNYSVTLIVGIGIALSVLAGFFNSFVSISCNTSLQSRVSFKNRGKVFGFLQSIVAVSGALPILLSGILADRVGVTNVFGYLSLLIIIVFISTYKLLNIQWR